MCFGPTESEDRIPQFRDIMVFDVTYKTNKFRMPSHHLLALTSTYSLCCSVEHSHLFGYLPNFEDVCLIGFRPLFTDQDAAICWAVGQVFPQSRHQYCMWHVRKHELEHVHGYRSRYPNFGQFFRRWVRTDMAGDFEDKWHNICQESNVEPRSLAIQDVRETTLLD